MKGRNLGGFRDFGFPPLKTMFFDIVRLISRKLWEIKIYFLWQFVRVLNSTQKLSWWPPCRKYRVVRKSHLSRKYNQYTVFPFYSDLKRIFSSFWEFYNDAAMLVTSSMLFCWSDEAKQTMIKLLLVTKYIFSCCFRAFFRISKLFWKSKRLINKLIIC